jgi:hypothetical protein
MMETYSKPNEMKINDFIRLNFPPRHEKYSPNMSGVLVELNPDHGDDSKIPKSHETLDIRGVWDDFKKCDGFSTAGDMEFFESPFLVDDNGRIMEAKTLKVSDDMQFYGRVIIYQASISDSVLYDPHDYEPVLKGARITPVIFDGKTFEPKKRIIIEFSPEIAQDRVLSDNSFESDFRKSMHELLDEILDFPEAFTRKPKSDVFLRGYFERVESPIPSSTVNVENNEMFEFTMDLSSIKHFKERTNDYRVLFFFENRVLENGNMSIGLQKYYIPEELRQRALVELGPQPSRAHIEEFITRNERYDIIELNDSIESR